MNTISKVFQVAARADRAGILVTRIGLVVVLVWIGSLKLFHYEAEGIVPMVANSPFMSYFYQQPAGDYRQTNSLTATVTARELALTTH